MFLIFLNTENILVIFCFFFSINSHSSCFRKLSWLLINAWLTGLCKSSFLLSISDKKILLLSIVFRGYVVFQSLIIVSLHIWTTFGSYNFMMKKGHKNIVCEIFNRCRHDTSFEKQDRIPPNRDQHLKNTLFFDMVFGVGCK